MEKRARVSAKTSFQFYVWFRGGGGKEFTAAKKKKKKKMGKKTKKVGKGKEKTEKKTAKGDMKRARREEKKLSPEDDIDAILVTNYTLCFFFQFSSSIEKPNNSLSHS